MAHTLITSFECSRRVGENVRNALEEYSFDFARRQCQFPTEPDLEHRLTFIFCPGDKSGDVASLWSVLRGLEQKGLRVVPESVQGFTVWSPGI